MYIIYYCNVIVGKVDKLFSITFKKVKHGRDLSLVVNNKKKYYAADYIF